VGLGATVVIVAVVIAVVVAVVACRWHPPPSTNPSALNRREEGLGPGSDRGSRSHPALHDGGGAGGGNGVGGGATHAGGVSR
jgi:hypothetical protein